MKEHRDIIQAPNTEILDFMIYGKTKVMSSLNYIPHIRKATTPEGGGVNSCADLEGVRIPPPWNLQSLISPDMTGNEKIRYFSYLCTSTVIRQSWTPLEKFSGSAPDTVRTQDGLNH